MKAAELLNVQIGDILYHRKTGDKFRVIEIVLGESLPIKVKQLTKNIKYFFAPGRFKEIGDSDYWIYDSVDSIWKIYKDDYPNASSFIREYNILTLEDLVPEDQLEAKESKIGLNLEGAPDVPDFPSVENAREIADSYELLNRIGDIKGVILESAKSGRYSVVADRNRFMKCIQFLNSQGYQTSISGDDLTIEWN